MDDFTHRVQFAPAYDHRDDPKDQRGAGSMRMFLVLNGPLGAIVCNITTGWMRHPLAGHFARGGPQQRREHVGMDYGLWQRNPTGAFLGSHSPTPGPHDLDGPQPCDWLPGGTCYGDGSYTQSDLILEALVEKGDDVWDLMREYYDEWLLQPSKQAS